MKALKGLLIYIGIVLAICLGIAIILFAGMYFFPSFRIAGIGVIHGSARDSGTIVELSNYSNISDIDINCSSKQFSVILNATDEDKITYDFSKSVFGISYDITEYKLIKDVSKDGNTLKINLTITEPYGLISNSSSYVSLFIPSKLKTSLLLTTTSGDVKIGTDNAVTNLGNLTVSTQKGKLNINSEKSGDEATSLKLDSLNLSTNKGYFDMSTIDNLKVSSTIKLKANNGTFSFKNVQGSFDVTGKNVKLNAENITSDYSGFKFISENGFFDITKITTPDGAENTIVTENCDVIIDEISGKTGIITTYGDITIGKLNSYATLQSEHGNVSITSTTDDINIVTYFGNITVDSYLKNARFVSTKGDIDVKSKGDYEQGVYTQIENTDGAIVVENKVNELLVTTYGASSVEITYKEIKGELNENDVFIHKVNLHKDSSAIIYMPTKNYQTPFKFKAQGNISGEISGLVPEYGGDKVQASENYQYFPTASFENEELCEQSCFFDFIGGTIHFTGYLNV